MTHDTITTAVYRDAGICCLSLYVDIKRFAPMFGLADDAHKPPTKNFPRPHLKSMSPARWGQTNAEDGVSSTTVVTITCKRAKYLTKLRPFAQFV